MAREKMPDLKRKGNWKNAPGSQKKVETRKAVTTSPSSSRSAPPKPKAKPAGAGAKLKAKPAAPAPKTPAKKSNDSRSRAKTSSGASRSVKAKVDNGVVARLKRGAKRLMGQGKNTSNKNFKANRPR